MWIEIDQLNVHLNIFMESYRPAGGEHLYGFNFHTFSYSFGSLALRVLFIISLLML